MSAPTALFDTTYASTVSTYEDNGLGDIHFGDTIQLQFPSITSVEYDNLVQWGASAGFGEKFSHETEPKSPQTYTSMYLTSCVAPAAIQQSGYRSVAAAKKSTTGSHWVVEGDDRDAQGKDWTFGIVGRRNFYLRNKRAGGYLTLADLPMYYPQGDNLVDYFSSRDALYTCDNGILVLATKPSNLSQFWSPGGLDTRKPSPIVSRAGYITPCAPMHQFGAELDSPGRCTHYIGATGYSSGPTQTVTPGDDTALRHPESVDLSVVRVEASTRASKCATPEGDVIDDGASRTYYASSTEQCGASVTCSDMATTLTCVTGRMHFTDTGEVFDMRQQDDFVKNFPVTSCSKEANCQACTHDYLAGDDAANTCPASTPYCRKPTGDATQGVCSTNREGAACQTLDGFRVASGTVMHLYKSSAGSCSYPCIGRRVECKDGMFQDSRGYEHVSCTTLDPAQCADVPDACPEAGLEHGETDERFRLETVGCEDTCPEAVTVTCTDGVLSDPTAIHATCSVASDCTTPRDATPVVQRNLQRESTRRGSITSTNSTPNANTSDDNTMDEPKDKTLGPGEVAAIILACIVGVLILGGIVRTVQQRQ